MHFKDMNRTDRIRQILTEALAPLELEIIDESAQHAGHNPQAAHGETHYRLCIKSGKFSGLTKVDQHRLIYSLLSSELYNGLHALTLETSPLR